MQKYEETPWIGVWILSWFIAYRIFPDLGDWQIVSWGAVVWLMSDPLGRIWNWTFGPHGRWLVNFVICALWWGHYCAYLYYATYVKL